jgi:hypothetical protein
MVLFICGLASPDLKVGENEKDFCKPLSLSDIALPILNLQAELATLLQSVEAAENFPTFKPIPRNFSSYRS